MKHWLTLLALSGILLGCAARAQPAGGANVRAACRDDVQRLCQGVRPGGGRIRDCMVAHKDELSAPCREALLKAQAARTAPRSG